MTEKELLDKIKHAKLNKQTKLNLSNNQLTKLPKVIGELENLHILNLSGNRLNNFPKIILKLKYLTELNLSNNQLKTLPNSIGKFHYLREFKLSGNQLKTLPNSIGKLIYLTKLDLSGNQLSALPDSIGELINLVTLNLTDNLLKYLPDSLMEIRFLDELFLSENLMPIPPVEITDSGVIAVIQYIKSLSEEQFSLNEFKVLLVGDGGVGKTSLVKKIISNEFNKDEPQTNGIKIDDWDIRVGKDEVNIHFWDFGGQEIMHATHQFFLSKRSFYILVLDSRKDDKTEYWLKHIESFGGESPILIVINKIDENPGFDLNRNFLRNKYKGIKAFCRISCKRGDGIKQIKTCLFMYLSDVEIFSSTWGKSWFNVKRKLEHMKSPFISDEAYNKICTNENIKNEKAQKVLVDYLNDLGTILHFNDFDLNQIHVLNPRWATSGVYRIINFEMLAKQKGVLKLEWLIKALKEINQDDFNYPRFTHRYLIDLMKKFELCYEINPKTVLIPDLLEVQEPLIDFNFKLSLKVIIEYDFLPRSILPRFIVKIHNDIYHELKWRTGVVIHNDSFDATAVIRADNLEKKIFIYVNGIQRKDYLAIILFFFNNINKDFEKIDSTLLVPLPDNSEITVPYQHLINLLVLKQEYFVPVGAYNNYSVLELLGSVTNTKKIDTGNSKTFLEKINQFVKLTPSLFGCGIDINKMIDEYNVTTQVGQFIRNRLILLANIAKSISR